MANKFRWLHFSDLHFAEADYHEKRKVIKQLWVDLQSLMNEGLQPDLIFFTGDIAFSGKKEEYDIALNEFFNPLLNLTKIPNKNIFLIPGNHDSNWAISDRIKNPFSSFNNEETLCKLLITKEQKDILLLPFENYSNFVKTINPCFDILDPSFSFYINTKINDVNIVINGFNSALFTGYNMSEKGIKDDKSFLAISDVQLNNILQIKNDDSISFCLMHHPFDYLVEYDRFAIENRIKALNNIILHGHIHNSNFVIEDNLSSKNVVIPAGALHDEPLKFCSYNIAEIDYSSHCGTLFFRRYNHKRNEWIKDLETTGEANDGKCHFVFSNMMPKQEELKHNPKPDFNRYTLIFEKECEQDLINLSISQEQVKKLLRREFESHVGYFEYDLEEYPFPVKSEYFFYLHKVQDEIIIRRVLSSTTNLNQLSSWNQILSLYRRLLRLRIEHSKNIYDPSHYLFRPNKIKNILSMHENLRILFLDYFKLYEGIDIKLCNVNNQLDSPKKIKTFNSLSYYLNESYRFCDDADKAIELLNCDLLEINDARITVTTALESSLQHFHKVILSYIPVKNNIEQI